MELELMFFGNKIIKGSKNNKVIFIVEISREKIAYVVLITTESKNNNLNDCEIVNVGFVQFIKLF